MKSLIMEVSFPGHMDWSGNEASKAPSLIPKLFP